jgi:hypothetical protein
MIQAITSAKSAPSARSAARSTTSPPDRCGRAKRVTNARIASSSTPPRLLPSPSRVPDHFEIHRWRTTQVASSHMPSRRDEADQTFGLRRPAPIFPVRDLEMALDSYARLGFRVSRCDDGYEYATRERLRLHLRLCPERARSRTIRPYTSTPPRSMPCTRSGSDVDCGRYRRPAERRFMTRRGDVGRPESPSVASATSSKISRGVSASSRSWISTTPTALRQANSLKLAAGSGTETTMLPLHRAALRAGAIAPPVRGCLRMLEPGDGDV